MPEALNPAQSLLKSTLDQALKKDVLSYEHLVAEIGLKHLVRAFPRQMWTLIHEKMAGLHIAPIVEVKDDNHGNGNYNERAVAYLVRMIASATSDEFGIVQYKDVVKQVDITPLILKFPQESWMAITRAMAGFGLAYDPTSDVVEVDDTPAAEDDTPEVSPAGDQAQS
ncbi:hypothetical protein GWN26_09395 [Candidatus Saccharibacteria bacterium]|nr:hypothetical protein [Candidatus Saccharibacteria bacterium]NIV03956.1 hypothetical protein [Calditrichia bacterium]NIS38523.1 hypothetical protein [Candidatus Saccharibacteria bacterium]NIV72326.1 hypothetical protein [Calditrichia bacterium]NIV99333.1 hypothetical protein [Candidatus Saccharibacteria bacterium]